MLWQNNVVQVSELRLKQPFIHKELQKSTSSATNVKQFFSVLDVTYEFSYHIYQLLSTAH